MLPENLLLYFLAVFLKLFLLKLQLFVWNVTAFKHCIIYSWSISYLNKGTAKKYRTTFSCCILENISFFDTSICSEFYNSETLHTIHPVPIMPNLIESKKKYNYIFYLYPKNQTRCWNAKNCSKHSAFFVWRCTC